MFNIISSLVTGRVLDTFMTSIPPSWNMHRRYSLILYVWMTSTKYQTSQILQTGEYTSCSLKSLLSETYTYPTFFLSTIIFSFCPQPPQIEILILFFQKLAMICEEQYHTSGRDHSPVCCCRSEYLTFALVCLWLCGVKTYFKICCFQVHRSQSTKSKNNISRWTNKQRQDVSCNGKIFECWIWCLLWPS